MARKLFKRICDIKTLYQAWSKVRSKSSAPGIDYLSVEEFEQNLSKNLSEIQKSLIAQIYIPEPTRRIYIPKGDGEKRKLSLPAIKDKIVQEAVRMVIEPLFESHFLRSSFGYRPNKGPQKAVSMVEHLVREGKKWIAKADIDNFFESINHSLLFQSISERIWEKPILRLIELWLKIGVIDKNTWFEIKEGIPQGGVISPLLSNIYLQPFDKEMFKKRYHLIRYVDDFIFLEETKSTAEETIYKAKSFLHKYLSLNIESAEVRNVQDGFVYLGFLFQKAKKSIAPEKIQKMKAKICEIVRRPPELETVVSQLNNTLRGWKNYYGIGNCDAQFHFLEGIIFQEIANRLKNTAKLNRTDAKEKLKFLDFLIPKTFSTKDKFINLLLCKTASEPVKKEEKGLASVKKAILSQRRKYEKLLALGSNLIVSNPGSFLGKTSKRIVVKVKRRKIKEIPIFRLKNIIITSKGVTLSSDLVRFCCQNDVPIIFLNDIGYPYGYIIASRIPFHKLSLLQSEALKEEKGFLLPVAFIEGKIKNQINLLKYYNKYKRRKEASFKIGINEALKKMELLLQRLYTLPKDDKFINRLFGIEGQSASIYWSLIKGLLSNDVLFEGRERKGATDLVNSLLNYGYGVLYSQVYKAIILAGLNPNIGFLHRTNPDKPGLLYDLIEEFRQPVVDRAVIGLIRKKVRLSMQGIYLAKETKAKLIKAITRELNSKVYYNRKKTNLSEVIYKQAEQIVRFLRGMEDYRPFIFY